MKKRLKSQKALVNQAEQQYLIDRYLPIVEQISDNIFISSPEEYANQLLAEERLRYWKQVQRKSEKTISR